MSKPLAYSYNGQLRLAPLHSPPLGEKRQYAPCGILALEPKAFGLFFDIEHADEPEISEDGVVIIDIRGPLMHHRNFFFDSYDAIKSRVAAAIELNPRFIILSIDSPGGLLSGAFDTARIIRKMVTDANVDLYSHVGGVGASAGYALATSAEWIGVSQTAIVGSVGVLDALVDATAQNEMFGVNVKLVASGQRKTDGNPDEPLTEGAVDATQARVNELAEMFFALVAEHGYGGDIDALRAMQADVFTGEDAVARGLATEVITFEKTLAFAKPGAQMPLSKEAETKGNEYMGTPLENALDSLREAAQGDDEEEAEKARKLLKTFDDDEEAQDDEDEEAQDEDEDEEAQDEDEEAQDEEEDEEASARAPRDNSDDEEASTKEMVLDALAQVHTLRTERNNEKRIEKRDRLIASRPDFSNEMVAALQTAPMKTVRKMVKTLPVDKTVRRAVAATTAITAVGVRGIEQGNDRSARLPPAEKAALDARMGLADTTQAVMHDGNRMIFGATVPKKEGN